MHRRYPTGSFYIDGNIYVWTLRRRSDMAVFVARRIPDSAISSFRGRDALLRALRRVPRPRYAKNPFDVIKRARHRFIIYPLSRPIRLDPRVVVIFNLACFSLGRFSFETRPSSREALSSLLPAPPPPPCQRAFKNGTADL